MNLYLEIPTTIAKVCGPLILASLGTSGDCPEALNPVANNSGSISRLRKYLIV
jgi:hypothetical protein